MSEPIYTLPEDYHPGWCGICGSVLDDPLWPVLTEEERRESDEQNGKDPDGFRCWSCGRLCNPAEVIPQ